MTAGSPIPRIALIGISGYGRIHLQLARECRARGEIRITAATVINPAEEVENIEELKTHGCTIYSDYQEMLQAERGKIDLCLIPTGIHWHARMTIAALNAGANVLVEKPLAGSLAEVEAVRQAERAAGRFVAVGFQDLYDPATSWLKTELSKGVIGDVRSVRFLGLWPRSRSYFTRNDWAGRSVVNGMQVLDSPLNNAFAHFVMLSLFFASNTPEAAAATLDGVELFRAHEIPSFDTAVVTAHTAHGVKLWFGVSHACREALEPEIVIHGSAGTACWRYENEAWLKNDRGEQFRREIPDTSETRRSMMAAVLRRLANPAAPICCVEMAARHTELIEGLYRTAAITTFPAGQVTWAGPNGTASMVPEVSGLEPALRHAFSLQESLAHSGFALASPQARR